MMRHMFLLLLAVAIPNAMAQTHDAPPGARCGELLSLETAAGATLRYALAEAEPPPAPGARSALVMLVGGGGFIDLNEAGCPQRLNHNSLVRMSPLLRQAGIATVFVDVPSNMRSEEGLGGFRIAAEHAEALGKAIAEVRARVQGPVWVAGHSRGSISATNAAARLTGAAAPDGVILMSPMLVGEPKGRRAWVAQTVFSVDLEMIKLPLLAIGHAADSCVRSPAALMDGIVAKTRGARQQVVTVTGGRVAPGRAQDIAACEVNQPHDFVDQETEVAAGIVRFMHGGSY